MYIHKENQSKRFFFMKNNFKKWKKTFFDIWKKTEEIKNFSEF